MDLKHKILYLEQLLGQCYKTDNIHYMDWNQLDWHLVSGNHSKLTEVNSTHDDSYGVLVWEGNEYEFLLREGTKLFYVEKWEHVSQTTAKQCLSSNKVLNNINRRN